MIHYTLTKQTKLEAHVNDKIKRHINCIIIQRWSLEASGGSELV